MDYYKGRLNKYIKDDIVYKDYLQNPNKEFNDFEKFCIEHCEDIKKLLEENEKWKSNYYALKKEDELL